MKKLAMIMLFTAALAMPAAGEVQTYEDEYVSFQYDDEIEGFINRYYLREGITYSFEDDGVFCQISIAFTEKTINQLRNAVDNGQIIPITLVDDGTVFALVSYDKDAQNKFWPLLSESAKIKDGCDFTKETPSIALYKHYPYSEQALNYARKALEICNDYLSFKLDGKEAGKQIDEVAKRAKSYLDSTGDAGDEDVYFTINYQEMNFRSGDDGDIMNLKKELEMILSNAE